MLTAIGRASVQRVLVRASALTAHRATASTPSALVAAAALSSRQFTTSLLAWFPAASNKPTSQTKKTTSTKKTAAKPKAAAKKKKAAPKPKPKAVKKDIAPEEKFKKEIQKLKLVALLKEPKKLPETAWTVFNTENIKPGVPINDQIANVASEYRSLSASQLQIYTDTAERNKLANNVSYKAWVESHPPAEIEKANRARRQLRRKLESTEGNRPRAIRHTIRDDRLPKGPSRPFALFSKSRWASGDLSGSLAEVSKQLSQEYKELSPAEKKVYEDLAAADSERYAREVQDVLGREVRPSGSP